MRAGTLQNILIVNLSKHPPNSESTSTRLSLLLYGKFVATTRIKGPIVLVDKILALQELSACLNLKTTMRKERVAALAA